MAILVDIFIPAGPKRVIIAIPPQIFETTEARNRAAAIISACDAADKIIETAVTLPGKPS